MAKLEDNFIELEKIIKQMESGDMSLEDSFSLYEKGMKIVSACNSEIDKVEKQLKIINDGGLSEDV
ncbi:MAG: exodeoxyribonuclease VII small subunit [Lachnospiraceae bacterium]|nr:exodeoxyribonuclease VII small subunit [Lachnospiraceae bacterium]